jgi:hypothetical protein
VLKVSLPSDRPPSHWTKRGAAMICALTDWATYNVSVTRCGQEQVAIKI